MSLNIKNIPISSAYSGLKAWVQMTHGYLICVKLPLAIPPR